MPRRKEPRIPDAILDQLLAGADPRTAFDPNGLLDGLKKALAERALNAEMDHHLGGEEDGNSRNGYGRKTVVTDTGRIDLEVPRDRRSTFDPRLIAKYQRRLPGFDDKIVSMYARGMSTREIAGRLRDLYGIVVSPDLISAVTDAGLEEIAAWQARPLEAAYPLVFLDALRVKIRDEGLVRNKAVHTGWCAPSGCGWSGPTGATGRARSDCWSAPTPTCPRSRSSPVTPRGGASSLCSRP